MFNIESLLTFVFASTLLCLAPGPDNIFVLTQSALYGKMQGVFVTLGLCTGLIVHTTAVALGVAAVFQASELAFSVLKTLGALYLLYLAWQAFSASGSSIQNNKSKSISAAQLYRRGIIMNITNPKVSIFFLAFLPQFAMPENGPVAQQIFMLGFMFIIISFVVFSGIAFLAGSLGAWLSQSPKAETYLNRVAGTVFIGMALKLITTNIDS